MASCTLCRVAAPPLRSLHPHQSSPSSLCVCFSEPCSSKPPPQLHLGFAGRLSSSSSFSSRISVPVCRSALGGRVTKNERSVGSFVRNNKKSRNKHEDDDFAWEALFEQLERDLENDTEGDNEDGITEEDVVELEREIEAAISDVGQEDLKPDSGHAIDGHYDIVKEHGKKTGIAENDDDSWEEEMLEDSSNIFDGKSEAGRMVKLERWQVQKLAAALEVGKRQVNIKSLAAEVGLDRADVLSFLRNPPLELLTKSALDNVTGDEPQQRFQSKAERVNPGFISGSSRKRNESAAIDETKTENSRFANPTSREKDWARKKRIRKQHLETFELVYQRTRRPTDAMILNLVQLTNVPCKHILEWFDKRRLQSNTKFSHSRKSVTSSKH